MFHHVAQKFRHAPKSSHRTFRFTCYAQSIIVSDWLSDEGYCPSENSFKKAIIHEEELKSYFIFFFKH